MFLQKGDRDIFY